MSTFTCTLPDELLQKLNKMAIKLSVPKNRIIEDALQVYFDQLKRDEYEQSFKMASKDVEMIKMVEEGLLDFGNLS